MTFHPVRCDSPELAVEVWEQLGGADPAAMRFNRGVLLATADAMAVELSVVAVRDGDRLCALGVAMLDRRALGGPLLSLIIPGTLLDGPHGRGLWVTSDEADEVGVLHRLLEGVKAHAQREGLRLVISFCSPDDPSLRTAIEGLGARPVPAGSEYRLVLSATDTFESYLARLGDKRRNFVRDLRRPLEGGATVVVERPAREETLRRCWPLQLEAYRRFGETVLPRAGENIFMRLQERLSPETIGVTLCQRGDTLLGFLLFGRVAQTTQFLYVGHIPLEATDDLQVYVCLVSQYLRHEINDGARVFLFGSKQDSYKQRLGFTPHARVHYYFRAGSSSTLPPPLGR